MPALRERPHRRPVDVLVRIEAWRDDVIGMAAGVDLPRMIQLPIAEELHVVRVNGLGLTGVDEIREASAAADLVAVEHGRIALDRLAERARLGLSRRAPLARALAPQAAPERAQALDPQRQIAAGPMNVQPGIGLVGGARDPCHDPADGADQMPVPGEGLFRRDRAHTAAVAQALRTRLQAHRRCRPVGTIESLVAASRALRPAHGRMVLALEARDIQRDRPLVERRRVPEHQPLGNLGGGEAQHCVQDGWRCGIGEKGLIPAAPIAQECVDLLMAAQAVSEAGPARAVRCRTENGAEERLHALGPDQHPGCAGSDVASVEGVVSLVEVIGADDDGQARVFCAHRDVQGIELAGEAAVVPRDRHPRRREPLLGPAGRGAERRPVGRPAPLHLIRAGDDIPPGCQSSERLAHVGRRMPVGQRCNDLVLRAATIEERQDVAMNFSAQQRIERF